MKLKRTPLIVCISLIYILGLVALFLLNQSYKEIVYADPAYHIIFGTKGQRVVSMTYNYNYQTTEIAEESLKNITRRGVNEDNIKSVKRNNKTIVISYQKSVYQELRIKDLDQKYAKLKRVTKK